ncbi:potassium/proton antiporter [Turneriella parva]|uniref:Potassium/proton antiporter, CPA1 family n=1 Tax=Turneriella parva (strain ATCC BAA-1111 / DSM 21527 / NCTC 11395 / H) TaxID=869212 RepID=I4B3U8_TURPD|nr:potassium/proton antiporter [Turneriella parva]AFM11955.1 potassium/proton antiporter, CPA1 family [Turneriella parva DSM 21527]
MQIFDFHGYSLEAILFAAALLVTISVIASRISSRFGIPLLLVFLGIGMLAGSDGVGGIVFDNYRMAFAVGSACLALIVFDGGMSTSWSSVRPVLRRGISLSVLGTLFTGAATATFANLVLRMHWSDSILLGAIVSSTDAAAVFSLLRARSVSLQGTVKQTLEFEAASNDPIAIFLTVGVLLFISNPAAGVVEFSKLLVMQAGIGLAFGYLGGLGLRWVINNAGIEYEGLYGVLALGLVVGLFALTGLLGGSGFLAIYVAGIVLGNNEMLHKASISRFLDGIAWIAQIIVFLMLGLLSFPTRVFPVWKEGLLLAVFMMFIARPLAVFLAVPGRNILWRERVFISWVGLRGAAPVILATYPWSIHFPRAEYIFDLVFFVVISSVIAQGISIPWLAKTLQITVPLVKPRSIDFAAGILPAGFLNIEIHVSEDAAAAGQKVVDLELPAGVILTSVERGDRFLIPRGDTLIETGDRIFGLARQTNLDTLRDIFGKTEVLT